MKAFQIFSVSLLLLTATACTKTDKETATAEDEAVLKKDSEVSNTVKEKINWDEVDITSPIVKYDEVSNDVEVRGTDRYSVYSLDESILFDVNKSTFKAGGEAKLKEIIASVKQRYPEGDIAVKGYTDSTGDKSDNKDLSKERAQAVADYMKQNGIPEDRIEVRGKGEKNPVADNDSATGRAQNRRVEIVARD